MQVDWVTVFVSAAINTPAVAGLLGWLGQRRLAQESAEHKRELEKLKAGYVMELEAYRGQLDTAKRLLDAQIETTVLVTKVHFETEFGALKEVFAKLAELNLLFGGLRPVIGLSPPDQTREGREEDLSKALVDFVQSYNELMRLSEHLSPFYPPNIYKQIGECINAAKREIVDLQTSGTDMFGSPWYHRGDQHLSQYGKSFTAVSDLIRTRIAELRVIRNS
jgi:hypothetical protein